MGKRNNIRIEIEALRKGVISVFTIFLAHMTPIIKSGITVDKSLLNVYYVFKQLAGMEKDWATMGAIFV